MSDYQQRIQHLRNRLHNLQQRQHHGHRGGGNQPPRPNQGPGNNRPPQPGNNPGPNKPPPGSGNTPQPTTTPPPPLPWNAQYETTVGDLRNTYNQTLAGLQAQQNQTQQDYGFGNNANPYSKAAQLQQDYQQGYHRTLNDYAAHGQLYAGSTSNAVATGRERYNQSYDSLQRDYASQLNDLTAKRLQAQNDLTSGIQAAEAQRLQDALNARPDPNETPIPTKPGGGGKNKPGGGSNKPGGGGGGKNNKPGDNGKPNKPGGGKHGHQHDGGGGGGKHLHKREARIQKLLRQARRHDNSKRARRLRRRLHHLKHQ